MPPSGTSLLERGRQQGSVHAEQVTHVLRHVELTGDVLDTVQHTLTEDGISLDETVDGEVDEADDGRHARRPPSGSVGAATSTTRPTSTC